MNKLTIYDVANEIRLAKKTLVLCHRNPDPDTLGSAYALKHILEYYGSNVEVACADEPNKKFSFITGNEELGYKDNDYERMIAVDVASSTQLGGLDFLADRVDLTIDHHAMSTRFSNYYERMQASCAENIYELAEVLGITDKMPLHFYECLYAGMSADTGCFKYSNVTAETMKYASKILERKIDHAEINRIIFDSKTMEEIKGQRLTYENVKLFCDGKLAIVLFTNKMKEDNGIADSDIGDIVNYIRSIEGVLVAVSLKETREENKYSLSSRSNADIDVSLACAQIGGGGHKRAAGATLIAHSNEEAISTTVKLFGGLIKAYDGK